MTTSNVERMREALKAAKAPCVMCKGTGEVDGYNFSHAANPPKATCRLCKGRKSLETFNADFTWIEVAALLEVVDAADDLISANACPTWADTEWAKLKAKLNAFNSLKIEGL